jgi:hypothetical protein
MSGSFHLRMFGTGGRPYRNKQSSFRNQPMGYPCIPEWEKTIEKDPFDYKLRTKEEVMKQH